ncbi:MAG: hypothetical protein JO024_04525, partial [Candidatus Eremiobacteraeota bacterium]|nr:hypothetical protein [Candidatus Eremiobacteraeota bacterium]
MRLATALVGPVFLLLCFASPVSAENGEGVVQTIAGSGISGVADGESLRAQFLMPAGVAVGSGKIYVSDSAAQRIKAILPSGIVRTVAGGGPLVDSGLYVRGGYRDGAALQARFNRPTGIALGQHGELYIADTYNHCIRVLSPDGRVSTFAGNARKPGLRDGPRPVAQFTRPLGIATDTEGNLYVADVQLRKITPTGDVVSLPFGSTPLAVAVKNRTLFISDLIGIVVVAPDGTQKLFPSTPVRRQCNTGNPAFASLCKSAERLSGDAFLGFPLGIAALSRTRVMFTDVRSDTIRTLDIVTKNVDVVGGVANEDFSADGGGYRNGPMSASRYNAPYGLAVDATGRVLLADAGNKRIRSIQLDEHPTDPSTASIVIFGGPSVYYATTWPQSIAALVQSDLNRKGRPVAVAAQIDQQNTGD